MVLNTKDFAKVLSLQAEQVKGLGVLSVNSVVRIKKVDRGLKRIKRSVKDLVGAYSKIGVPKEKNPTHPDSGLSLSEHTVIHEKGSPERRIPARPFMRQAFDKNLTRSKWLMTRGYNQIIEGAISVQDALKRAGDHQLKAQVKEINDGQFQPLAEVTIEKKGHSRKLIDSKFMRNHLSHVEGRGRVKQ